MVHFVKFLQVSGQCIALGRREYVANIAEELHDAFGCLIGELKVCLAGSLKGCSIDRGLCQSLDGLDVCGLQLCVQGEQIADRLLHQGADFGFLLIGCVDLDIEVLEDVVDVRGHVCLAHHAVMPAIHGHCGCHGADSADEGSTG